MARGSTWRRVAARGEFATGGAKKLISLAAARHARAR